MVTPNVSLSSLLASPTAKLASPKLGTLINSTPEPL